VAKGSSGRRIEAQRSLIEGTKTMASKSKSTQNGAETMETVITAGTDAVKQSMEKAMKSFDDIATFNKSTVDALVKSANAASKGLEALSAEVMSYSKQSVEDYIAATKAAMSSRSVQEFMEVNTDYAKTAFDTYVGKVTKLSDMASTTAKDTFEPLSGRLNALMEIVQAGRA